MLHWPESSGLTRFLFYDDPAEDQATCLTNRSAQAFEEYGEEFSGEAAVHLDPSEVWCDYPDVVTGDTCKLTSPAKGHRNGA